MIQEKIWIVYWDFKDGRKYSGDTFGKTLVTDIDNAYQFPSMILAYNVADKSYVENKRIIIGSIMRKR